MGISESNLFDLPTQSDLLNLFTSGPDKRLNLKPGMELAYITTLTLLYTIPIRQHQEMEQVVRCIITF
ncbi:hypothetical protein AQUCO_07800043v1 [Aquilegia coerulea]|uniref:Uncharacterized protein n=1 Tax=Aquilegia coerulea TaxID=218851 RepID=A0A2G5C840_AQUCA|nr:hypothetical protein AQUCO_07800043v1 [Aquilegia coerulea]